MAGRRDYKAEYRRRQQLARERGFTGYWQARNAKRPRTTEGLARLPEAAREARKAAFRVVQIARQEKIPVEVAASRMGVPMAVVRYWAPEALAPATAGRTAVTKGDRLLRLRPVILEGSEGVEFIAIRGSRAADRAAAVFDVQWRYINGDASEAEVRRLAGLKVSGRPVESDPDRLEFIGVRGGFDADAVYRELVS